jgi:hypothetical protein
VAHAALRRAPELVVPVEQVEQAVRRLGLRFRLAGPARFPACGLGGLGGPLRLPLLEALEVIGDGGPAQFDPVEEAFLGQPEQVRPFLDQAAAGFPAASP